MNIFKEQEVHPLIKNITKQNLVYCIVTHHISTKIETTQSLTYRRESDIEEITECG